MFLVIATRRGLCGKLSVSSVGTRLKAQRASGIAREATIPVCTVSWACGVSRVAPADIYDYFLASDFLGSGARQVTREYGGKG